MHESSELMIVVSGQGKGGISGEEVELRPLSVLYAPAGRQHRTMNTGEEPMEIACVFIPPVSASYVEDNVDAAESS